MCKLKFKEGDKVRIIRRKPNNRTGLEPDCDQPNGNVGQVCYISKGAIYFRLMDNVNGWNQYFGLYSTEDHHFNDDDLELVDDFVLPEKWAVKTTPENYEIVYKWLNIHKQNDINYCKASFYVDEDNYVHYPKWAGNFHQNNSIIKGYTEITYEQFCKYVLNKTEMVVQKLTLGQLKDLYNGSDCGDWKEKIINYINAYATTKDDTFITIKDEDIDYARQECNEKQLNLLKDAGIKFEKEYVYKAGDWVTFTKDCRGVFKKGDVKQLSQTPISKLLHINDMLINRSSDLSIYFRPATEEEILKAKCPYKDGDLLWVKSGLTWELRYSNGTLTNDGRAVCYTNQNKSGTTLSFPKHELAKNVDLPND